MDGRLIYREKRALAAHRDVLRGGGLPLPSEAPKGTFLHGFFLPFSLIRGLMRDAALRGPYLRVVLVRALLVGVVGTVAIAGGDVRESGDPEDIVVVHRSTDPHAGPTRVDGVDALGMHIAFDDTRDEADVTVLGQHVRVQTKKEAKTAPVAEPPPSLRGLLFRDLRSGWTWLLGFIAILSAAEAVIVFLSRRWDDWLSHCASRLASIRPEDDEPKVPRLALDIPWLYRKLKRRIRGYIVFGAGLPMLLPLRLVPSVGHWLFAVAAMFWGWYWLGVFSAAKSAHAWADEDRALPPAPIRTLNSFPARRFLAPVHWYGRTWARVTRSVNPAATTFERTPAAFLGLALARVVLSLPGLYLLARPIIPVAAGRLCAEADPTGRFTAPLADS